LENVFGSGHAEWKARGAIAASEHGYCSQVRVEAPADFVN